MVSAEIVQQVSEIYHKPAELHGFTHTLRSIPSVITSASVTGLIVLALIVAAAQVRMAGSDPMTVRVTHAGALRPHAPLVGPVRQDLLSDQPAAIAEAKAGKERRSMREKFLAGTPYEVEIKPPPRPAVPIKEESLPPTTKAPAAAAKTAPKSEPQSESARPALTPPPSALPKVAAKVAPAPLALGGDGGPVSLQVGAFRELRSAAELKARVQRSFPSVHISRIESGGEPLYRVRVGQFPDADATEATKLELQAAGYPSFRVTD